MSRGAFIWHIVKPLLGLNLPHVLAESHLHSRNLARTFSSGEIVPLAAVQAVMAYVVSGAGRQAWLLMLAPVSAATVGLFLSQLRGIAEHGVRDTAAPRRHVRSHRPEWAGRILLYGLNFNLHEEHHRHPAIPSCELPASTSLDLAHKPSMWQTLAAMLARS